MTIDPWILTFSLATVLATVWMGFWSARKSKTAHDFFVAGRSVSVGWNASAISGEYLSAASFMGVAGMVMKNGYDALWYPVCYACGYLFLLLFIAGPLRRFGAYTIPDFAEGRYDSPLFRKIAVIFVLFIGFFYTMPQMKGAGTTLAYIFPGLPYWAGVVLVGAVITLNVALGGMKGITLVQAVQYWAKMFAISAPVFVLMAVYGNYGNHLKANASVPAKSVDGSPSGTNTTGAIGFTRIKWSIPLPERLLQTTEKLLNPQRQTKMAFVPARSKKDTNLVSLQGLVHQYSWASKKEVLFADELIGQLIASAPGATGPLDAPDLPARLEQKFATGGVAILPLSSNLVAVFPAARGSEYAAYITGGFIERKPLPGKAPKDETWLNPFGPLTTKAAKLAAQAIKTNVTLMSEISLSTASATNTGVSKIENSSTEQQRWLNKHERPLALLYTYSLIIALVCGTAGLPHILVRFYTNPDGVSAKRTTMWVMILIGVFYLFPPIFGVIGRNLLPELYGAAGAKGTDKIVLELPRILNERFPGWGSVLSGITCAGAFAAFMSTFSGLLVSMTGALAHDVYGRIFRPASTAEQRLKAFKVCAVIVGLIAIVLGMQVEAFDINFMVGQAFAIAAASYFPLLFLSAWWRNMTMKGAAAGMLGGGVLALLGISLTSFSDLKWLPLDGFWAHHPLVRILCEQPAIWAVPLAIGLMIVVSKCTRREVPADVRMKMLLLHAPEELGLKQEYISK